MERTFALINGGVVQNSVVADDLYIDFIRDQYQDIVETTEMEWKPGIGSFYSNGTFTFESITVPLEETEEEKNV